MPSQEILPRHLVSLRLDAYSSPDGIAVANKRLSESRAKRLLEYIRSRIDIPESLLTVQSHGIDWAGVGIAGRSAGYSLQGGGPRRVTQYARMDLR